MKEYNDRHYAGNAINMETAEYKTAHASLCIPCHDVLIALPYHDEHGLLLVKRRFEPFKQCYWPIGGRMMKNMAAETSLAKKAKKECSLDLEHLVYVGVARTISSADPFSHGEGTDTLNLMYCAYGKGTLQLDNDHESPLIITNQNFKRELRVHQLHPYVIDFIEKGLDYIAKTSYKFQQGHPSKKLLLQNQ